MPSKPIFISHAAVDQAIADKVVDLLSNGMAINVHDDVFCSSLEGLSVPPGKDFVNFIREQIQQPKIVVMLISQNYLVSQFCLAELGASWAMAHRAIPMLVPPVRYSDLKAVLVNIAALTITDSNDWNDALVVFQEAVGAKPNVNRWERKRDEFLEAISPLLAQQKAPSIVPLAKLEVAEHRVCAANEEIKGLEAKLAQVRESYNCIKKLKNANEVARAERENLPAWAQFESLERAAKKALDPLPAIVREAIYYRCRHETLEWPAYGNEDESEAMKRAIEQEFLDDKEERGVEVNTGDPKVARAIEKLSELRAYIDEHAEELAGPYEGAHDHELSFTSRRYWEARLI